MVDKKIDLLITGMHCASCATLLTKALKKINGVSEANVNYATEKATITYDPATTNTDDFEVAIKKKGYAILSLEA
ncbi:cation-translocating P-type ATPase, partial [Candidatus Woesearchaeota archaeon]|nr:cation-translocating P-type ATPase [Candidatus Woesearchaeota archaeon]